MFKVISTYQIPENTSTKHFENSKIIESYVTQTYSDKVKSSKQVSEDGKTLTLTFEWATKSDYQTYINDPMVKKMMKSRIDYNHKYGISSSTKFFE